MAAKYHSGSSQFNVDREPDPTTGSCAVPIYLNFSCVFKNTEHHVAVMMVSAKKWIGGDRIHRRFKKYSATGI
jgi:O-acetylhomoserine/O-acetylserine sulfhydrylase-like pyridoxal-dependent enzyme